MTDIEGVEIVPEAATLSAYRTVKIERFEPEAFMRLPLDDMLAKGLRLVSAYARQAEELTKVALRAGTPWRTGSHLLAQASYALRQAAEVQWKYEYKMKVSKGEK